MVHIIQRNMETAAKFLSHAWRAPLGTLQRTIGVRGIVGIIIGFGIMTRFIPYLHNRSLWLDEAWLALNIIQKSFSQLVGVLDNRQMAPVGFLFVEKIMVLTFGDGEYALRLFPLLAGILSLFLFYEVARRILSFRGATIALGLFAISPHLIRYSSELKQYSSDVTVALGIYLLGLICMEKESRFVLFLFLFSIAGAILIWFSHPAIFSLAGIGITLAIYYVKAKKWEHLAWLSLPACFWLSSFAFNYFILVDMSQGARMEKAWSGGGAFMPMLHISVWDLLWYQGAFFNMFRNPGGLQFTGLAAFCFVVGWVTAFYEKRYAFYFLTLPFLFTLFASGLHKYPFHGRLILFLVPAMMMLIGGGIDRIITLAKPTGRLVGLSLFLLLVLIPFQTAFFDVLIPSRLELEEARPVITYLSENYQDGDKLYLYHSSEPAFEYYAKRYGLEKINYHRGVGSQKNWDNYINDLKELQGNERVWILFSHVHTDTGVDEERFFVSGLNNLGTQLASYKSKGASVYLYDLKINSTQ